MLKQEPTDCFPLKGQIVNILGCAGQPVCQCFSAQSSRESRHTPYVFSETFRTFRFELHILVMHRKIFFSNFLLTILKHKNHA